MNILVTGAEGFVGSSVAKALYRDHSIIGLDYLVGRDKSNLPEDMYYINQDLSQINVSQLPEVDLVLHFAAISIERISETPIYQDINNASMLKVLEYVIKNKADLIFTSSGSVYGSGTNFTEDAPLNPLSDYSKTKILEENHAKFYSENYDLNVTILRYSNCYGDTTYIKNKFYPGKKGIMRVFMENAMKGVELPIIRNQSRDFTFIDDVVDATTAVIGLKGLNTFNVATGIETSIESIPPLIEAALGREVKTKFVAPRKIDNLNRRSLNIDKISSLWKPKHTLKEGLKIYANRLEAFFH